VYAELAIILFFVRNWSYSDGSDLIAEQHWRALRHPPCIRTFFVRQSVIGESPSLIQSVTAKWAEIGRCMSDIAPDATTVDALSARPFSEWSTIQDLS
jgi:hypothetical protein